MTTIPTLEVTLNRQSEISRRREANGTRMKESDSFRNTDESRLSRISSEDDYWSNNNTKISGIVEPNINDYDVDVLDDKNEWKPRLVFENKTEVTTATSVIMRIGPKKIDVELFNTEVAPFQEGRLKILYMRAIFRV